MLVRLLFGPMSARYWTVSLLSGSVVRLFLSSAHACATASLASAIACGEQMTDGGMLCSAVGRLSKCCQLILG